MKKLETQTVATAIAGACLFAGLVVTGHRWLHHDVRGIRVAETVLAAADGHRLAGFFDGLPRVQHRILPAPTEDGPQCASGGLLRRVLQHIETTVYGAGRQACTQTDCSGSYATCQENECPGPDCVGTFTKCSSGGGQDVSDGFQTTGWHGCGNETGYECNDANDCNMDQCDSGIPGPVCHNTPTITCQEGARLLCVATDVWGCSDGSAGCEIPPPSWTYQSCQVGAYCSATGWQCSPASPIIIDAKGEGFHLTDIPHGVKFTFAPGLPSVQVSWTDPAFHNGFLVLDRNGDRVINDATELFGNLTPQPPSATPNGFLALAVFDEAANGGNGNGFIDPGDAVYDKLRVWIDANHNGVAEPGELRTLKGLGIVRIGLRYRSSGYVDEFGNRFRYRAKIWDAAGRDHDTCYDVFLRIAGLDDVATAQNGSASVLR